jgi:hypothetical protein
MEHDRSYGYPYGVIPRLLLFWITDQNAAQQKPQRPDAG